VKARGENIFPSIPCSVKIGILVRAMISSPKMLGFRTSTAARRTVVSRVSPGCRLRCRCTFSTWMIVASMTIPMEIARPPSDIRFAFNPMSRITRNVRSADSGSDRMTTIAPRTLHRNSVRTIATRTAPSPRARSTVFVLWLTTDDRS